MSNQQKDTRSSGSSGAGQGLREQARDSTGGTQGDALGHAVDVAAGESPGKDKVPPPQGKGGAPAA